MYLCELALALQIQNILITAAGTLMKLLLIGHFIKLCARAAIAAGFWLIGSNED